jgi:hypothetical protein
MPMALQTHNRLILVGFMLAYFGLIGTLASLSFGPYGMIAIKFVLLPAAAIGIGMITLAKFTPIRRVAR